jgi:hypothetical protein
MKNIHVLPTDKPSRLIYNNRLKSFCFQKEKDGMYINDGKVSSANFWSIEKAQNNGFQPQNIYITNDEDIKEGDWFINKFYIDKRAPIASQRFAMNSNAVFSNPKKIILTTDQDLIADGVQAIEDDFLEWFVKNPTYESVRVNNLCYGALGGFADAGYKIIIPKEEPKLDLEKEMFELEQELDIPSHLRWHNSKPEQETLEEAAENHASKKLQRPITIYTPLESNVAEYVSFVKGAKWQQEQDKNKYSEEEVFNLLMNFWMEKRQEFKTNPVCVANWFEQFKKK